VDDVCSRGRRYNLLAILNFTRDSKRFLDNQLQYIHENYGKSAPIELFARRSYFCSAFVVACYVAVGIIGAHRQVAYPENFFSPGHLARDPTFGWLLGYLIPKRRIGAGRRPAAGNSESLAKLPELALVVTSPPATHRDGNDSWNRFALSLKEF
jgi:hypothetical protein